jgi:Flp pilus assembly pilin Flp
MNMGMKMMLQNQIRLEVSGVKQGKRGLARLISFRRNEDGLAGIEMALILPVLIVLLLGSVEMFHMSQASRKLTLATTTMGDLVTQAGRQISISDINGYYNATVPIMSPYPTRDRLAISVFAFHKVEGKGYRLKWKMHLGRFKCAKIPKLTNQQKRAMRDGNDLVITHGCYKYRYTLGSFLVDDLETMLNDEITFRPRNTLKVNCQDCNS